MQAGRLRHRVLIEQPVTELDSDGANVETWAEAFPAAVDGINAHIAPLSGRDLVAAQAVQSKVTTRITLRYLPGLVAGMRVTHRSTIYNIHAVIQDARSGVHQVTLLCSSGVNQG